MTLFMRLGAFLGWLFALIVFAACVIITAPIVIVKVATTSFSDNFNRFTKQYRG